MKIIQLSAVDLTMKKLLYQLNIKSKEAGFDVHCVSSSGKYVEEIKNEGFRYHIVEIDRKISPILNLVSLVKLIKLFKNEKPDIIHVHTPIAGVLGRIAAKIAGVPCIIYTAHGFYFHDEMSNHSYKIFYNVERIIGKYFTDFIFTQSKEDFDIAKKGKFLSNKNKNNYLHISNGIDLSNLFNLENYNSEMSRKLREEYNINDSDIVVSFIGRQVKEKGIFDLLESINLIKAENVKFLIIGAVTKDERDQESAEKIKKFLINDKIIFAGHRDDIPLHLYISDIFCLPSYREGMPRSIIEAMAMRNAVLATNIRGSREEVVHGETGFLFPTNSSKDIAKYIDILVEDRNLLEKMKVNGLNRAKELFDEDEVINKQISIFEKIRSSKS